jgi:phospholipid-translocating ATPase
MVISEIVTLLFYVISIAFLPEYFGAFLADGLSNKPPYPSVLTDLSFVVTVKFLWKLAVIVAVSALPLYIGKMIRRKVAPAASSKLL